MEQKEKSKTGYTIGGIVFAGCMLLGGGIGILFDAQKAGGAIGMGVGFIAMAIIWIKYKQQ